MNNNLKDKIESLIIGLGLTSTRFADYIGVNRPIISHILSGRNKPSLEIIQKIVSKFPELGYNWISDDESIDMEIVDQIVKNKDFNALFSSFYSSRESNENKLLDNDAEISNSQASKSGQKTIQKILVFYTDNTFSQFDPYNI
ncbi:XRE family transcriptional regulator [Lacihabitans sp. LS3-19]|uniref:helix-turn-helix transcriptional regulator n=1 Tax=Lacihabitans sp. LS3-19 TaxID=2487335 RepID=UPI0020CC01A3|nr:helix-turn-helix transcriptional regulator [Lacihabitans sp. LS3-19]MCP9768192.1 XRE family transcriptional regulator [Lacihabitans sp. LS3-19]